MTQFSYIMQGKNLVMVIDSVPQTVTDTHPNYRKVIDAVQAGAFDTILDLIDMRRAVVNFSQGLINIVDDTVMYRDEPVHNSLASRMLDMIDGGFDVSPLINFLDNLLENPSKQAVDELYLFLEGNSLPLTSDGHFLAYKNVSSEYKDKHSGTFDNSIGSTVKMPRNKVQDNRDITCSTGLHFCSLDYLGGFYAGRTDHTMILKINPRDVVSIPSDYNNAKGRCCEYVVVGEHLGENRYEEEAFSAPVHDYADPNDREIVSLDEDDNIVDYYGSVDDASSALEIPAAYIKRVLRGDRARTGGFGWGYAEEHDELTKTL